MVLRICIVLASVGLLIGLAGWTGQRWDQLNVTTPLAEGETLIIGFHGGRDDWDDESVGVGRMASRLRAAHLPGTHVQAIENTKRDLALRLVRAALDRNLDGTLDSAERDSARIILYGQSFGGAAVVKFARQLHELDIPVLLTVQVDSIGRGDVEIPPNVRTAANLFQRNGKLVRGPAKIRASDPARTKILGNWQFDYRDSKIDVSDLPWHKTIFRRDHARMDRDPRVWQKVEELILSALKDEK